MKRFFDYNKGAQKTFSIASKVDKRKSEAKPEESTAEKTKLRRQRLDMVKENEKKHTQ